MWVAIMYGQQVDIASNVDLERKRETLVTSVNLTICSKIVAQLLPV